MNYQRIYEQLTATDMIADYTEKHHIIPKCMGGTNDPSNLVRLTPEAHYVAHQLLVKIYPTNEKLVFAANRMVSGKCRNNKLYGWLKRKHSQAVSNLHKGRTLSDTHKAKISNSCKGMSLEARSKISSAHKGKPKSAEHNAKNRASNTGKIRSAETRANISAAQLHREPISENTRNKLRLANNQTSVCPHCAKEVKQNVFNRWHGKNCRTLL